MYLFELLWFPDLPRSGIAVCYGSSIFSCCFFFFFNWRITADIQSDFEKVEEPEIKLPTSAESLKKQESSRKTSIFALLTMPKPLTVWITINCGKF